MLYEQSVQVVSKSDRVVTDGCPNYSAISIAFPKIIVTMLAVLIVKEEAML